MSHRAVLAILEDFELHRDKVLPRLRTYFTPAYFAVLTRLMESQLRLDAPSVDEWSQTVSDEEANPPVGLALPTPESAAPSP
jgi:hypothetical protein